MAKWLTMMRRKKAAAGKRRLSHIKIFTLHYIFIMFAVVFAKLRRGTAARSAWRWRRSGAPPNTPRARARRRRRRRIRACDM